MLTDEIINQIYEHELHPKYSKFGKLVFYILSFILLNFTIYILISDKDIKAAATQLIIVICIICESQSKRGFRPEFIDDLVSQLIEINRNIAKIKDNRFRVEITQLFNYYIDILIDRPNAVSKFELSKLNNKILYEISEEEYNESAGFEYKTEEQIDEERRREQEEYTRRLHEEKRKQKEKEAEEKRKKQESNSKTKYFNGCFTMDELNKRKKELLKQYHPDNHNNDLEKRQCEEISKQINEEFIIAKNAILNDFDI